MLLKGDFSWRATEILLKGSVTPLMIKWYFLRAIDILPNGIKWTWCWPLKWNHKLSPSNDKMMILGATEILLREIEWKWCWRALEIEWPIEPALTRHPLTSRYYLYQYDDFNGNRDFTKRNWMGMMLKGTWDWMANWAGTNSPSTRLPVLLVSVLIELRIEVLITCLKLSARGVYLRKNKMMPQRPLICF